MSPFATVDTDGFATGFYDSTINQTIPAGAVPLTEAQYLQWIENTHGLVWNGSALVAAPVTLAGAEAAAAAAAQTHYAALIVGGFTWHGVLYAIDPGSQADITAEGSLALAAITQPTLAPWPNTGWLDKTGHLQTFDAPTFLAFSIAVAGFVKAAYLQLNSILASITAAGTVAAVQAIDVTAGYPAASA